MDEVEPLFGFAFRGQGWASVRRCPSWARLGFSSVLPFVDEAGLQLGFALRLGFSSALLFVDDAGLQFGPKA